jgi:transposase
MILGAGVKAYVCAEPIDMRKSVDGLAQLVGPLLAADAFLGSVFVLRARDKVKILWWDRHGFWLAYKRLEHGRFAAPGQLAEHGVSVSELMLWLEGVDLARARRLARVEATRLA